MKLVFTPEAASQVDRCDDWWRRHRPASSDLFERELIHVGALLERTPLAGAIYRVIEGRVVRRIMLRRTNNHVYYVLDEQHERITIHAVWGAPKGTEPDLESSLKDESIGSSAR